MKKLKKRPLENNFAFLDSQNLNLGVRSQGWRLDFAKFRVYLKDKYKVGKAFLFIGYVSENQSLYTYLQKSGYICVFKPTLEFKKTGQAIVKGNVDAELVLQAMIEYPNYQKAVIVSGDGDFLCLVEYLERQGKLLKIIVPNRKFSSLLKDFSSHILNIGLLKSKLREKTE